MISCEEFEERFPYDQSMAVLEHLKSCPFCRDYSEEIARIRKSVGALPAFAAPLGFEARLFARLDTIVSDKSKGKLFIPNAFAFASGLALAVLAGFIYTNNVQENSETAVNPAEIQLAGVTEINADSTVQDTSNLEQTPWSEYWDTESVSSQR
jgi:hypothetical protein